MKQIIRIIAMALAVLGPVALTVTSTGCRTTPSAEVTAFKTIKASDIAVETAIRVWAEGFVKREAANERTRAEDPGGYLERRSELVKEHGRVVELRGRYSAAVRIAVEAWILAKERGATTTPEPVATAEISALQSQIESIAR